MLLMYIVIYFSDWIVGVALWVLVFFGFFYNNGGVIDVYLLFWCLALYTYWLKLKNLLLFY